MSTLTLWTRRDPFFAEFDALVRNAFAPTRAAARQAAFTPSAEVQRDGEDAVVRLELPGLDVEKDVTVELADGRLVVRGERRDERSEDGEGRTVRELRYGAFSRSFALPKHVTADNLSASYDAGVLTVRVTGAYAGSEPRRIAITS
jgi:HSP20 family protein